MQLDTFGVSAENGDAIIIITNKQLKIGKPMTCRNCGASFQGSFCSNCGTAVSAPTQPSNAWSNQSPQSASAGSTYSTAAMVLGAIAVFLVPILFGGAGIVLAVIAKNKGEKNANVALTVAILCTIAGIIFGAAVGASTYSN